MRFLAFLLVGALLMTALPASALDYAGATWYPASTSNYTVSNRESTYDITYIVVHTAQGSYGGTISWFQNPSAQASSHFVVAQDGRVAQMVATKDVAWHAGNWEYNTHSIGTEHEGFVSDPNEWTEAMYVASAKLTRAMADRYGIALVHPTGVMPASATTQTGIIGHNQVPDPNNPSLGGGIAHHTDPGPYFDWNHYMDLVRSNGGSSDTTPPVTYSSLGGAQGTNGWWVSPVTVSLSASDPSGIRATYARIDGGGWFGYGGPFAVGGDGGHTVYYYSVDGAGNTEGVRAVGFSIDTTPPSTSPVLSGVPGNAGWWRSAVTFGLNAFDGMSGVASTTRDGAPYAGPITVSGDGAHGFTFRSVDRAGNVEPLRGTTLRIDTQPPSTQLAAGAPSWQGPDALFVTSATKVTLPATDATSGVASSTWSWNGQAGNGAFTLRGADASADLAYRSVDVAGNAEAQHGKRVALDNTPPALSLDQPAQNAVIASVDPVHVAPVASDAGSGVDHVDYVLDGELRASVSVAPFAWDWAAGDEAAGRHILTVTAVDHVGNAASLARNLTTVATSLAGAQATAAWSIEEAKALAAQPPPSLPALPSTPGLPVPTPPGVPPALPRLPPLPSLPALPGVPATGPPRLPVVGLVADVDPATGAYRLGATTDGDFHGIAGQLPAHP